ncbi:MAG TPA: PSD1 and planctomycete cytochrome C domain-containing protein [Tepidisphaeraceae bacterium]|jgi:hypothetical protein
MELSPAFIRIALLLGSVAMAAVPRFARAAPAVDFNRDIRPILSANCFKCHGIDDGARKSKLRLDVRQTATSTAKSGKAAIVPGHPDQSELIRRVFANNPDDVMPPASTKVTLSATQKQLLKRWVAEGAEYKTHWAFVAPRQVALPPVKQADWPRNPIDHFVLARLESEGLQPAPEADRYTLIRRVYLDLIGLPPTPEEADAFAKDPSPDAYDKLVDRLLANPHYGERWARRWLDLARYADTNGFEKDRPRSIWPYRDWVINALNADMPFDQFTIKQLAGDMLPDATPDDRIATGFHRNTMLNEEGGIDPLEYRFRAAVDRNNTTGTTWLGLTVRCAQCHTHKFDPITQTEYYRLMAFLNNADEPEMAVPSPQIDAKRKAIETKIAALTAELPSKFRPEAPVKWETPIATCITEQSDAQRLDDGSWRFAGPSPDRETYTFTFDTKADDVDRIRLEAMKDGDAGPGRTKHGNFVLTDFAATVAPIDAPDDAHPVKFARAEADAAQNGFPAAAAIHAKPGTGWAVDTGTRPIPDHTATFFLDKPVHLGRGARWTITLKQQYGEQHTLARLRLSLGSPEAVKPGDAREALDRAFHAWADRESSKAVKWTVLRPVRMQSTTPFLTLKDDGSVLAGGDISKSDTYDLTFHEVPAGVTAVRLEVLPDDSLPSRGPGMVYYEGTAGDFFLSEITLDADGKPAKFAKATQSFAAGKFVAANAIDGDPQSGWSVAGAQGQPNLAVFALAEPLGEANALSLKMLFERYHAAPLGHFRISVTTDPRAGALALPPEIETALATAPESRSDSQRDALFQYFLSVAPELAEARKQIDQLRASIPKPSTTLVLAERPAGHDRPTYVHHRGEFLQREQQVTPGVPAFLPPLPAGAPDNRLTFARWLVSPENPLTARVTVNRQWQAFFGRGIVRTVQDFGYQGDLPSHPELLDWLAIEFRKEGWSLKKLDRLMVTSATYRQASLVTPESLEHDPQDVLLSRAPRFRLEAELIRDSALAEAGLLSATIGGPSVFPPQPASVTTEGTYGALPWKASTGSDRFRRSLYTFSKRTAPFAMYNTFDGPTGEECIASREVSDTPLQALTLLNDTMFMEAAQALGRTIADEHGTDEQKAADAFRRCLTRAPDADEVAMLTSFARDAREQLKAKEVDPVKLAGGGKKDDPVERATWTAVARSIMNLDEAVTKE